MQAALAALREWCENTDEIDERLILNGLAKAAVEADETKDRISALIALAKIRRMGAFGGAGATNQPQQVTQTVMVMQSFGVDAGTGRISDASKFADSLARAFGADQAAGMLAQLGIDAPLRSPEPIDITPAHDADHAQVLDADAEPGLSD